ncbi:MAG: acyl-CoA reductase [Tenericutes bacterium]|nr:acyl-CoA reductase [Mycoplasmatota bacterium]
MILYKGIVYDDSKQIKLIQSLKNDCYQTLSLMNKIEAKDVIDACDQIAKKVRNGDYDETILPLLSTLDIPIEQFEHYISMFERDALEKKVKTELGVDYQELGDIEDSKRKIMPLGILFHIAAGNVDALPAYSVIEGLLAGNINILKLPSGDNGLSIQLLKELIDIEPKLKDFIYVFDVPSTEIETLKIFAQIADGVVVWGGDVAVSAARQMAPIDTKVIAWGHKLSFAYATLDAKDEDLEGLANHICETNQLLCSSCQGIFVDTDDRKALDIFAKRFFDIFLKVSKRHKQVSIGMRGKNTITLYFENLESHKSNKTIFHQDGISVISCDDQNLELSMLFRNVWVKRLNREDIIKVLKPHKNHLQTAGLLCAKKDANELSNKLLQAGLIRITKPKDMARYYVGETHDGTYALREYTRVVEFID